VLHFRFPPRSEAVVYLVAIFQEAVVGMVSANFGFAAALPAEVRFLLSPLIRWRFVLGPTGLRRTSPAPRVVEQLGCDVGADWLPISPGVSTMPRPSVAARCGFTSTAQPSRVFSESAWPGDWRRGRFPLVHSVASFGSVAKESRENGADIDPWFCVSPRGARDNPRSAPAF